MEVLTTSIPEKLPEDVRRLIDPNQPLPGGVQFFEERFTFRGLTWLAVLGVGLTILGMLLSVFGTYCMITAPPEVQNAVGEISLPLVAGVVVLASGVWLLGSLRSRWRLQHEQHHGKRTRYGIFLIGDLLVWHSRFETTVIPRQRFRGLKTRALDCEVGGRIKTFELPHSFVDQCALIFPTVIREWAAG